MGWWPMTTEPAVEAINQDKLASNLHVNFLLLLKRLQMEIWMLDCGTRSIEVTPVWPELSQGNKLVENGNKVGPDCT